MCHISDQKWQNDMFSVQRGKLKITSNAANFFVCSQEFNSIQIIDTRLSLLASLECLSME